MNTLVEHMFRQRRIGRLLGNLKQVITHAGIYFNTITMLNTALILYQTKWIQTNLVDLSFWQFMGIFALLVLILLFLVWKLDLPSTFAAWNHQVWSHDNPMRTELEAMHREIQELRRLLREKQAACEK